MLAVREALDRKNISVKAYAAFLGIAEKSARNKLSGKTEFSFHEALVTKKELLPEYDFEYLFSEEPISGEAANQ